MVQVRTGTPSCVLHNELSPIYDIYKESQSTVCVSTSNIANFLVAENSGAIHVVQLWDKNGFGVEGL